MSDSARHSRSSRGKSTRVDAPHGPAAARPAPAASPLPQTLAAIAGHEPAVASDQLQKQAAEIGAKLQAEVRQLDHREAEFNARVAHMESELRTARLICREREEELADSQRQAQQRFDELRRRNADLAAAGMAVSADHEARREQSKAQSVETEQAIATWHQRLRQLDRDERQLKAELASAASVRQALEQERVQLAEQKHEQTTELAALKRALQQRHDQQWGELQERAQQVDRRRLAVQQLHGDISRMYREALELRLCNEEIWARLTESMSEAELTRSQSELRRKLADQFQLATQAVVDRQSEVQQLLEQLEHHQRHLREQRDQLRQWMTRRHEEVEQVADKLLKRERELDQREANLRHAQQQWLDKERDYQQELRRLRRLHSAA